MMKTNQHPLSRERLKELSDYFIVISGEKLMRLHLKTTSGEEVDINKTLLKLGEDLNKSITKKDPLEEDAALWGMASSTIAPYITYTCSQYNSITAEKFEEEVEKTADYIFPPELKNIHSISFCLGMMTGYTFKKLNLHMSLEEINLLDGEIGALQRVHQAQKIMASSITQSPDNSPITTFAQLLLSELVIEEDIDIFFTDSEKKEEVISQTRRLREAADEITSEKVIKGMMN